MDTEILASGRPGARFFEEEARFRALPLEDKVRLVITHSPRIFQVETTTRCNLDCPLCSTHHLKRGYTELPLELMEKICDANPQIRYACLHLMGEPLLSRALFSIVRHLKRLGVFTFFSTNGLLLERFVDPILWSGLDKISVSVDGITQEDLSAYRVNADLDAILRGIRRLKAERDASRSARPLIQTQTIMFAHNEEKEEEVVRFFKNLGVDRIKLKMPSFEAFGGRNGRARGTKEPSAKGIKRYSRSQGHYVRYRDRAVCRLLFQGFVLSNGSVVPCCIDFEGDDAFGNLKDKGWYAIRTSEERKDVLRRFFRGRLEICKRCSLGYDYSITAFDRSSPDCFS